MIFTQRNKYGIDYLVDNTESVAVFDNIDKAKIFFNPMLLICELKELESFFEDAVYYYPEIEKLLQEKQQFGAKIEKVLIQNKDNKYGFCFVVLDTGKCIVGSPFIDISRVIGR